MEKSNLEIITRMYRQQKNHFWNNDSRESIPNRIVSLSKPHLRPIVRGKEVKSVEFGAKVNNNWSTGYRSLRNCHSMHSMKGPDWCTA